VDFPLICAKNRGLFPPSSDQIRECSRRPPRTPMLWCVNINSPSKDLGSISSFLFSSLQAGTLNHPSLPGPCTNWLLFPSFQCKTGGLPIPLAADPRGFLPPPPDDFLLHEPTGLPLRCGSHSLFPERLPALPRWRQPSARRAGDCCSRRQGRNRASARKVTVFFVVFHRGPEVPGNCKNAALSLSNQLPKLPTWVCSLLLDVSAAVGSPPVMPPATARPPLEPIGGLFKPLLFSPFCRAL